jgi:hypothetical protein
MGIRVLSCMAAGLLGGVMALGQSLTDHAAAIAGASAGVAGGRVVSDALSRILESASDTTGAAAAETKKAENRPARGTSAKSGSVSAPSSPAAPIFAAPSSGFATSSSAPSAPARPWRRPSADRDVASSGVPVFVQFDMPPPPPAVTSAELRAIAAGTSRADVVGKVGVPAARITMDDDGHLVEILEYTANGNRVGSVRCSDGHVESVDAAER